jgi:hypothetical protein
MTDNSVTEKAMTTLPDRLPMIGLDGIVLAVGGHSLREQAVCAMEAVAWLAGEPHSDHPKCACLVIGAFMRSWNDSIGDDATRTRLIKPLLPSLVGTRSTRAVELKRSYLALDWLARVQVPAWLDLRDDLKAHAVALRGLKPLTDTASCRVAQTLLDKARTAAAAAWDAAWAAARAAAWDAARAAARAAAWDAAGAAAWDAAWAAAVAAAVDAAGAAARAAAWDAARAAAVAAAVDAAGAALAPTVTVLQASAQDLIKRMVEITAEGSTP